MVSTTFTNKASTRKAGVIFMQEIWKDIPNYQGFYQISNFGNVKSLCFGARNIKKSNKQKLLKSSPSNCGYYKVELYKDGKSKMFYVHRLVANAFIPNPDNKPQVNHIDGNKANNSVSNLEWCTHSENQRHAISMGLRKSSPMLDRKGKLSPLRKPILQYTKDGVFVKEWDCISDVARYFNCGVCNIIRSLKNESQTSCGYKWKYSHLP